MKNQISRSTLLTGALLIASFAGQALAQSCNEPPRNPQNVVIEVANGQPQFSNKFCNESGSQAGDLCNGIGDRPSMVFKLQGNGANSWEFVRMELSADGSNWSNPVLPQGAYDDLGFSPDPNSPDRIKGWPPASLTGSNRQMTVQNDNCNSFTIYYRLLLRNQDGSEIYLHPRIRNGGRI